MQFITSEFRSRLASFERAEADRDGHGPGADALARVALARRLAAGPTRAGRDPAATCSGPALFFR